MVWGRLQSVTIFFHIYQYFQPLFSTYFICVPVFVGLFYKLLGSFSCWLSQFSCQFLHHFHNIKPQFSTILKISFRFCIHDYCCARCCQNFHILVRLIVVFLFLCPNFLTFCPVFCRVNFVCFRGFSGLFMPDFTQSHRQSQIRYFLQKLGGVGEVQSFLFQHNLLRPFSNFIPRLFIKLSYHAQFQLSVSFLSVSDEVMWLYFRSVLFQFFLFLSSNPHFREFYSHFIPAVS